VASRAGTGERYATQVGALWSGLAHTLTRLEAIAAEPERLEDEKQVEVLRRLQYGLHSASEHAFGLSPPAGTEPVHTELADALAGARDSTARVVDAVDEWGRDAAEPLVWEWRGALFRVRLARLRLAGSSPLVPSSEPETPLDLKAPLAASLLVLAGSCMFVAGALSELWPVWLAGMIAVCSSVLAFRR
jgi:hypothetical protein